MNTVIDLRKPQGDYGGSMQAVSQILQHLGQVEADRKERELTDTVLSGLSAGKDFGSIMADVSGRLQSPSFAGGARGLLQRTAGAFGPHQSETGQILSRLGLSYMDPRRQATAEATGARAELYGEQAETARQMRPVQVGATAAQEAARRATEALTTQRVESGADTALAEQRRGRAELLTEQAKTEPRRREKLYPQETVTPAEEEPLPPETPNPAAGAGFGSDAAAAQRMMQQESTGQGPQTVEDFEDKVAKLKQVDMDSARAFYDKWVGKFRANR